tara:strand:+ start:1652 stop:2746 length:1095 start_codon:yes stop_codon:yes gene_type:complete
MDDRHTDSDTNTPSWAVRLINLLKEQNSRLEEIADKANEIADASNKISNRTNRLAKITGIITGVALVVSYLAYQQTESQFSRSLELQKQNALMTEILTRQRQNLEWIVEAKAFKFELSNLCDSLPNAKVLRHEANIYGDEKVAEAVLAEITSALLAQANRQRLLYLITQTAILFPNNLFNFSDEFIYESTFSTKIINPYEPISLNIDIYEDSLNIFLEAYRKTLFTPENTKILAWLKSKYEKGPPNIDNTYLSFPRDATTEKSPRRLLFLFTRFYSNSNDLNLLEDAFLNIELYVYGNYSKVTDKQDAIRPPSDPRAWNDDTNNYTCNSAQLWAYFDDTVLNRTKGRPKNFEEWRKIKPKRTIF